MRSITVVLATTVAIAALLAPARQGAAAAAPSSWQRQTLLAATDDEYLVLEAEGENPGEPDVWTETLRLVRFDARSNARGETELVHVETWTATADGERRTDASRASRVALGASIDAFGGRLAPPPAIRLKRDFHVDEAGVYVFEGERRVAILMREEIDARAARDAHAGGFGALAITALQQIGEQYYLTLRGGAPRVRREIVMRIPR